ncbi:GIY-YIG nuclease family protein [Pseudalkalibacillus hwajinpoensis]|uniref:GIY-YIG nuclease family protein n=1 Tax=Guptibacillus hwajinpoensis TaxID=208199 RepID=UPI00325B5AFF
MTSFNHVVYILQCRDGSYYTGYTNDLSGRIAQHEGGKGAKYTRGRTPLVLVYQAAFMTKREAMQEEYRIKQLTRTQKEKIIKEEVQNHVESAKLQRKRDR